MENMERTNLWGRRKVEDTIEQTINKVERLNRILTVIVIVELVALLLFL
jgi:hypothetical protein